MGTKKDKSSCTQHWLTHSLSPLIRTIRGRSQDKTLSRVNCGYNFLRGAAICSAPKKHLSQVSAGGEAPGTSTVHLRGSLGCICDNCWEGGMIPPMACSGRRRKGSQWADLDEDRGIGYPHYIIPNPKSLFLLAKNISH